MYYYCPECKAFRNDEGVTQKLTCVKCNSFVVASENPQTLQNIDTSLCAKDHIKIPFTKKYNVGDLITIEDNQANFPAVFVGYTLESILVTRDFGRTLIPLKYTDYKKTWSEVRAHE